MVPAIQKVFNYLTNKANVVLLLCCYVLYVVVCLFVCLFLFLLFCLFFRQITGRPWVLGRQLALN